MLCSCPQSTCGQDLHELELKRKETRVLRAQLDRLQRKLDAYAAHNISIEQVRVQRDGSRRMRHVGFAPAPRRADCGKKVTHCGRGRKAVRKRLRVPCENSVALRFVSARGTVCLRRSVTESAAASTQYNTDGGCRTRGSQNHTDPQPSA